MRALILGLLLIAAPAHAHHGDMQAHAQLAENQAFERSFGDAFLDSYWSHNPDAAILAGYYKYADRLIVPDEKSRRDYLAFTAGTLRKLDAVHAQKLDGSHRADLALLRNQMESAQWYLNEFRDWQWNPAAYNVADSFAVILSTDYAPLEQRLRTVSRRLKNVPAYYKAAKANIKDPVPEFLQLGIEQNQGALGVFGEDLERTVAGSKLSAAERADLFTRIATARSAIQDYVAFLKTLKGSRSFRIGKGLYDQKFRYDIMSGYSAEQLYQRALAEKERLHARMDVLADELWPKYMGKTQKPAARLEKIAALIGSMSQKHVAREGFVDEVKRQIPLLEKWVNDKGLLTQDPTRPLQVRITPEYKRGFSIASIDAPGPYDPTANTYYNVSPLDAYTPEQAESFLREYNHWQLQILNIHEAVPGHYVQLVYANKSPSRIKSLFGNGAMVEGWAVYAEKMMLESGWGGEPAEMEFIHAKWLLRVTCNTILDYSLHVLDMPEAEAMKLLTAEAFQSQTEATGKWRRARLSSVQLTSYFAGYSEILEFREQQKQALGAKFDLRRFHEQFLSYGSAPVRLIRELMTTGG